MVGNTPLQPDQLTQTRHFPPIPPVIPHGPLPKQWPPLSSPTALRFRRFNHRLDIELGQLSNTPRQERTCCFCQIDTLGDEYHSFKCPHFLDLQVYYGIDIQSKPQFLNLMQTFPTNVQRYISVLMSLI